MTEVTVLNVNKLVRWSAKEGGTPDWTDTQIEFKIFRDRNQTTGGGCQNVSSLLHGMGDFLAKPQGICGDRERSSLSSQDAGEYVEASDYTGKMELIDRIFSHDDEPRFALFDFKCGVTVRSPFRVLITFPLRLMACALAGLLSSAAI